MCPCTTAGWTSHNTQMEILNKCSHTTSTQIKQSKNESMSGAHPNFVVQFDEEMFALEAQLADLGPAERVDFGVSLKSK